MEKIRKNKKKIIIGFGIIILIGAIIFGIFKFYEHYEATKFENERWLKRHINLEENSEGVFEVKTDEDIDIFNLAYQNVIENKIEELKGSDEYSLEKPLIVYNPYGTGSLSYYVYLGNSYDDLSYEITTDGYAGYTHDLGDDDEYQLVGFCTG